MAMSKPVRTIEINSNERVVLQVRSCDYVRLEFPGMVVGIRCEDGVIYQYQEARRVVSPPSPCSTERYSIASSSDEDEDIAGVLACLAKRDANKENIPPGPPAWQILCHGDTIDRMLYSPQPRTQPPTPDDVVAAAGGHFDEVNERHAAMLDPNVVVRNLSADFSDADSLPSDLQYDTDDGSLYDDYHFGDTQN